MFLLLIFCNAVNSPSTPLLFHSPPPPPSQQSQLSSPVNQSWCLFNYWEQRGPLTKSFFQPSNSSISHFFYPLHSVIPSVLISPSLFHPHLPCSRSLSLSSQLAPFVLQCIFIFMDSNHSCRFFLVLLQFSLLYVTVTVIVFGLFLNCARPPSIYLEE